MSSIYSLGHDRIINEIEIRVDSNADCNRNVTITNLGVSSAPARDKGFHGVINAIFSWNTRHTRLRNKSGSIEMVHPPVRARSFFFLSLPSSLPLLLLATCSQNISSHVTNFTTEWQLVPIRCVPGA